MKTLPIIYERNYDVLVVGAGPAGSSAARMAAEAGAKVLLIDKKTTLGFPVQCAEFVPMQLAVEERILPVHIARRVSALETYLPDGEIRMSRSPGFVLHRGLFDKHLAAAAGLAGAHIIAGTKVILPSPQGIWVESRGSVKEIKGKLIIGADGPKSIVGSWMGSINREFLITAQCEAVLDENINQENLRVFFSPFYRGGYGWAFPKGETANVGVGCRRRPSRSLDFLLSYLKIGPEAIIGRTGGLIPVGGPVAQTCRDRYLLCGDAAGQTHPVSGAGIAHAILCGRMAGRYAARAALEGDLTILRGYEQEWRDMLQPVLERAVANRKYMEEKWTEDVTEFCRLIRETWIYFPGYRRKKC